MVGNEQLIPGLGGGAVKTCQQGVGVQGGNFCSILCASLRTEAGPLRALRGQHLPIRELQEGHAASLAFRGCSRSRSGLPTFPTFGTWVCPPEVPEIRARTPNATNPLASVQGQCSVAWTDAPFTGRLCHGTQRGPSRATHWGSRVG